MSLDLTPFGFTATESLVYGALLRRGPSSGYAVAKDLSIARANAYQALNGLVSKGAAERLGETPQRYRAVRPDALLSTLTAASATRLDKLEGQMAELSQRGGATNVQLSGKRALLDVALRTAAKERGPIRCLAPPGLLLELSPVWRRRQLDGRATELWSLGGPAATLPIPAAGIVDPERTSGLFDADVVILVAGDSAVVATLSEAGATGHWTSDAILTGLCRAALSHLAAT